MIREVAFGLNNRHYWTDNIREHEYKATDTFSSLWEYDDEIREYVEYNRTLQGWDGVLYMPDELILDIDGTTPDNARQKTIAFHLMLDDEWKCPHQIYFSGTGFHVGIPDKCFKWQPDKNLHKKVKKLLGDLNFYDYCDPMVASKTQLIRINNTRNGKSGLWKIPLTVGELHESIEYIQDLAKKPRRDFNYLEVDDIEPIFDVDSVMVYSKFKSEPLPASKERVPDPMYYPCIQTMLTDAPEGKRHAYALRIASHMRWRYPEYLVKTIMYEWLDEIANIGDRAEFTREEMDKIVEGMYMANGGRGYRYGCHDPIMDANCNSICKLFKAKTNDTMLSAHDMEHEFMQFVTGKHNPVDLGKQYGDTFPIYPGEFVILQAPPKSMKTTLVQNWMYHLKRKTYFLETEMSPRQIYQTFLMIESGKGKEHIYKNYAEYEGFSEYLSEWLTMEFGTTYADELVKKVGELPEKPDIVVIDHLHKLKSRKFASSGEMSLPEISEHLLSIAQRYNIIVIAIAEIDKVSIREGQHGASIKGGVSAIYDANKVLKIENVSRDMETGLIRTLDVKTLYNREEEQFNYRFTIENKRISEWDKLFIK